MEKKNLSSMEIKYDVDALLRIIQEYRKENNMILHDFLKKAGVGKSTYHCIKNREFGVTAPMLMKFAYAMNMSFLYLFSQVSSDDDQRDECIRSIIRKIGNCNLNTLEEIDEQIDQMLNK